VSGIGGAELSLIELIEQLDSSHYRPLLYVEQSGPLVERLTSHGVPVVWGYFPFFRKRNPFAYWRAIMHMQNTIRRRKIDLVQVNCDRAVPISVTAARLAGVPCICYIHDFLRAWYLPDYVKHLNQAQCIIADSKAVAAHCVQAGMRQSLIRVIYESVETRRFVKQLPALHNDTRSDLGLRSDAVVIGIIGKVTENKGHEELLRAFALASVQDSRLQLLVVGDTSMTGNPAFPAHLMETAKELNILQHVIFVGFREDVPMIMSAIDVLAVPSHSEAFGRSAAEALASGIPVIASDTGGLSEVVQHNVTGLLVPPKTIEPLAEAILQLSTNHELRHDMGRRGPASVAKFDVSNHAAEFMRLYADLTGIKAGQITMTSL